MGLSKTPVERVEAYYLGRKDGSIKLHNMHLIDFDQAFGAHPHDWALEPPAGKKILDKREPAFVFPHQPPATTPGPPMVPMDPDRIRKIVHAGSHGGAGRARRN